jgi:hypothetical protein
VVAVNDIDSVDDHDMASDSDGSDNGLVGFLSLVCMAISQVLVAWVDIPTSFSRCGILSVGTIWITVLAVQVGVVWVSAST